MPRPAIPRLAIAAPLAVLVLAAPAFAGGDVIDRGTHHRHHYGYERYSRVVVSNEEMTGYVPPPAPPAPPPAAIDTGPHRGNLHVRYVGGNYAYDPAYQEVLTYTNNWYLEAHRVTPFVSMDLVDPDDVTTVYHSGVPYSRSEVVPEHGGGGIYDRTSGLVPAPTRGIFYENRTRDAYVTSYDYDTENPACWASQQVDGQFRRVYTCAGR